MLLLTVLFISFVTFANNLDPQNLAPPEMKGVIQEAEEFLDQMISGTPEEQNERGHKWCEKQIKFAEDEYKKCTTQDDCDDIGYVLRRPSKRDCDAFCTSVNKNSLTVSFGGDIIPPNKRPVCIDNSAQIVGVVRFRGQNFVQLNDKRIGFLKAIDKDDCEYEFVSLASDVTDIFISHHTMYVAKRNPERTQGKKIASDLFKLDVNFHEPEKSKLENLDIKINGRAFFSKGHVYAKTDEGELKLPLDTFDNNISNLKAICSSTLSTPTKKIPVSSPTAY